MWCPVCSRWCCKQYFVFLNSLKINNSQRFTQVLSTWVSWWAIKGDVFADVRNTVLFLWWNTLIWHTSTFKMFDFIISSFGHMIRMLIKGVWLVPFCLQAKHCKNVIKEVGLMPHLKGVERYGKLAEGRDWQQHWELFIVFHCSNL